MLVAARVAVKLAGTPETLRQWGLPEILRQPLVLPEMFDGMGNWSDWCFQFENVMAVNGWNEAQKLQWLRVRVTGRAQKALHRLPAPASTTYELLGTPYKHASNLTRVKPATSPSSSQEGRELGKVGQTLPTISGPWLTGRTRPCRRRHANASLLTPISHNYPNRR